MTEKRIKERIYKKKNQFETSVTPSFPKNILIELSNICNHECIFCANSKMTRKKGEIDEEFLKRILKEAYSLGTREVGFYATGEPLIAENIAEYIRYAKDVGYTYVYITTNGALFNEQKIESIVDSGIDSIKFSINAGTEKTYKITHGKDNFNKVMKNLIYIDQYRKHKNVDLKLYISYVITKQNVNEVSDFKNYVENIVDDIVFVNARNQGGIMYEMNEDICVEDSKYDKLKAPCSLPFNTLTVTYEGYLSSCCVDFQNYLTIADLKDTSLKCAWESDKFKEFRQRHIDNKLEHTMCYNCINNTKENIEPLTLEHCTEFNYNDFDKTKEILERLK